MAVIRNFDHPAVKRHDAIYSRYAVAVMGAWAAESVTYPLDLMKTRLQIQSEVATAKHGFKIENIGLLKTGVGIVKNEGVFRLWGGLMPMLQRHAIYSGCRLVIYEKFREKVRDEHGHITLAWSSVGGLVAGSLAQFVASPPDMVKTQMQAEGRRVLQGHAPRFANSREAYARIFKESGFTGFWRGAVPNVQRAALVNMGDLATYDATKQYLITELGMEDNIVVHATGAFAAGFVAALLGTPADVLKTRLMNQPVGTDGKGKLYKGMIDCLQQSVKNEGILAIYKGFLPLWMRLGPWALINWLAFESIMVGIGGKSF